jgi:hypothetical protein
VPTLSVEQNWAEKFHAYTHPRENAESRVRDLVDLFLILEQESPTALWPEAPRTVNSGEEHPIRIVMSIQITSG